jgi:Tol biopolymer transport system component
LGESNLRFYKFLQIHNIFSYRMRYVDFGRDAKTNDIDRQGEEINMNYVKKSLIILGVGFFCVMMFSQGAQEAEKLFQKGIHLEQVKGELKEAIAVYQKLIDDYGEERSLVAKALLHIGICNEKMGKEEAQKAYQRIIREFSDQREIAAEAQERLASLFLPEDTRRSGIGVEVKGIVLKKIEIPDQKVSTHLMRLSPDGAKVLCLDMLDRVGEYGLFVVDLSSGQRKLLVEGVQAQTYIFFDWSPDSKRIVYKHGRNELRIVNIESGEAQNIWSSSNPKDVIYSPDWSWDGRNILFIAANAEEEVGKMVVVPSSGGEPLTVVTIGYNEGDNYPQLSPDGKSVVGQRKKEGNWDIYIWTIDGKQEIRLTEHPAMDSQPYWSPDGNFIVFMSDREKTEDLWAIPMKGIQPTGAPTRIKRNLGKNTKLTDFTARGTLTMFIYQEGTSDDHFLLAVDPLSGKAQGGFHSFAVYPTPFSPNWSPDGSLLAYTSRKGDIRLPGIFISQGGDIEEKEIPAPNYFVANLEWSRDGQFLVFPGWDPDKSCGVFRVSVEDFRVESLLLGDKYGLGSNEAFINLRWMPQAKMFSLDKLDGKNKCREVYHMDEDGRNLRLVTDKIVADVWTWPSPNGKYLVFLENMRDLKLWSLEKDVAITTLTQFAESQPNEGPAWSPDGNCVAWKDKNQLKVLSIPDNTSRILLETEPDTALGGVPYYGGLAWSPDGRMIAYVLQRSTTDSKPHSELWIVPTSGGTPRKISDAPSSHPVLGRIAWHPSGKMITAQGKTAEADSRTFEHWALENFLPKEKHKN